MSLVILMAVSLFVPAFGAFSQSQIKDTVMQDKLVSALSFVEPDKSSWGLEGISFASLRLGNPVNAYGYTSSGFEKILELYPILNGSSVVLVAIKYQDGDDYGFQITTGLTSELDEYAKSGTACAVIYDRKNCYIYSGNTFDHLRENPDVNEELVNLPSASSRLFSSFSDSAGAIEKSNITSGSRLIGYQQISTRSTTTYQALVSHVSQMYDATGYTSSNLCWAASCASVIKKINGGTHTALSVDQAYHNATGHDLNSALGVRSIQEVLSLYSITYSQHISSPEYISDGVLAKNLSSAKPIVGFYSIGADGSGACHFVVIDKLIVNSADSTQNTVRVMDPQSGFSTGSYFGSYKYCFISGYSGSRWYLRNVVCYTLQSMNV